MKRTPRLWRKRRGAGGKFYGSFHVTLKDGDVNLGTSDANVAAARLREVVTKGRRKFRHEIDEAAAAVEGVAAPPPAPSEPAAAPPAPPIQPDAYFPPPAPPAPPAQLPPAPSAADARAEADATNAAANDNAGPAGGAAPGGAAPGGVFSGEMLDFLLHAAGNGIVDLQLFAQAWMIRRRFKRVPGEIPPDAKFREMAADAWVAQLRLWVPSVDPPPWLVAMVLTLSLSTQQIVTSTPVPDDAQEETPNVQAAA